ncbi:MAG: hypothetical protein QXX30_04115 [Candidatus Aenigmatarchaeota archaeon]
MKLSEYAKRKGISYKTAWRWFKQGLIKGYQMSKDDKQEVLTDV